MRIGANLASIAAQRHLATHTRSIEKSFQRLSSGLRITRASDDPAGLAISERMRAQVTGLQQEARNDQDAIHLVQTAEGGLNEVSSLLIRMRSLSVQASNGTYDAIARDTLDNELGQLADEIDRISLATQFNGASLLDGSGALSRVGVSLGTEGPLGSALEIDALDIGTGGDPQAAIDAIDGAINRVAGMRASLGTRQRILESKVRLANVQADNLQAAESEIRDADIAYETAQLVRSRILQQAAIAILAQANSQPSMVLRLLQ